MTLEPANASWVVRDWSGTAADFHDFDLGPRDGRSVWLCSPTAPALVLGSTQDGSDVDPDSAAVAGIAIVRRRSGGGIVWVHPTDTVWIDVAVRRDDPLWVDDVSRSMLWLGEAFARALERLVPGLGARVHTDPFDAGARGRIVCFASAAPGEVFVGPSKVVGMSQRRTREGARFQCLVHRRWRPDDWVGLLVDPETRRDVASLPVAEVDVDGPGLVEALVGEMGGRRES